MKQHLFITRFLKAETLDLFAFISYLLSVKNAIETQRSMASEAGVLITAQI